LKDQLTIDREAFTPCQGESTPLKMALRNRRRSSASTGKEEEEAKTLESLGGREEVKKNRFARSKAHHQRPTTLRRLKAFMFGPC